MGYTIDYQLLVKLEQKWKAVNQNKTMKLVCKHIGKALDPGISSRQSKLKYRFANGLLISVLELKIN